MRRASGVVRSLRLGATTTTPASADVSSSSFSSPASRPSRWSRQLRALSKGAGEVTLGGVTSTVRIPSEPHLVPTSGYLPDDRETLEQIRWMMQKHNLGQDIYLMGTPGPRRRWLAMKYCHSLMKEVEYLSLSRDTTEADIKQRREMRRGGLVFVDQSAVRAAIHGRVLILDGVERVERNVLPIINNLLENREMSLEDGRFLTSPDRYDELLLTHTESELADMGLVKVSRDFRVIALGLPVPRYNGTPLDPPLRSRFQCLDIDSPTLGYLFGAVKQLVPEERAETIVGLMAGLRAAEAGGTDQDREKHLPDMIDSDLLDWGAAAGKFPEDALVDVLKRVYPYHILSEFADDPEQTRAFASAVLKKYSLYDDSFAAGRTSLPVDNAYSIGSIEKNEADGVRYADVSFRSRSGKTVSCTAGCGEAGRFGTPDLVMTEGFSAVLTDMVKDHCLGKHICVVGESGSGKSALAKSFAGMFGYAEKMSTIHCHWDMSARDMLQRRTTDTEGDTIWETASLADAAMAGRLVILDGVDKLQPGVLASIGRLLVDGETTLYDGTVLHRSSDYQNLLAGGATREELTAQQVFEVHPAFRVIALAHPYNAATEQATSIKNWVEGEVQHFFSFHRFAVPPVSELRAILTHIVNGKIPQDINDLLRLHVLLKEENEEDSAIPVMSLRQLRRIARSCAASETEGQLYDAVADSLLLEIMPEFVADRVRQLISEARIVPSSKERSELSVQRDVEKGTLTIGDVTAALSTPADAEEAALVPSIVFHDNQEHLACLRKLLFDFNGDSHILLIGRQGVGKNRLIDRMLQLLNRPRQYVQLHRDSTVSSLTVRPEVVEGRIVWEDAPLVKAVKLGHILVVDEIDKAPLEVVGILKGLVEDKELLLADGRRIVQRARREGDGGEGGWSEEEGAIEIHPSFRLVALANVPGFPFLGNDFFSACGDLFRCHLVDNPQRESRLQVLRQYGPSVPAFALNAMVDAFEDLAHHVEEGLLAYPYSLRELVAVVKHVEKYPDDGMATALRNVFAFDIFDQTTREIIEGVFEKHGIPLNGKGKSVQRCALAPGVSLPAPEMVCRFEIHGECYPRILHSSVADPEVWSWGHSGATDTTISEGRSDGVFDEHLYSISTPGRIRAIASTDDGCLHSIVEIKGSLTLLTFRGRDLYVPISSKPTHLDHSSHSAMDLARFVQAASSSSMFSTNSLKLELHAIGNQLLVSSEDMSSVLLIDPRGRTGKLLTPPLSSREESDGGIMASFTSKTPVVRVDYGAGRYARVVVYSDTEVNMYNPQTEEWHALEVGGTEDTKVAIRQVTSTAQDTVLVHGDGVAYTVAIGEKGLVGKVFKVTEKSDNHAAHIAQIAPRFASGKPSSFMPDAAHLTCGDVTYQNNSATVTARPVLEKLGIFSLPQAVGTAACSERYLLHRLDTARVAVFDTHDSTARVFNTAKGRPSGDADHHSICVLPNQTVAFTSPTLTQICIMDLSVERATAEWGRWESIIGGRRELSSTGEPEELSFNYSDSQITPNELKHGKEDPDNTPHVGGNTWAGGTGGTDTAGLGGKVGPYRIDAGHPIHQVSDEAKQNVPQHLKDQAKQMGQEALKNRLKEIHMSPQESSMYNRAHDAVRKEVAMVQTMLKGLRSKEGERVWLRNQTDGVWDESKLVEGITGEKGIYKKRGESPDAPSPLGKKKKRIVFCMDCSASMFRFNSMDHRLDRSVETAIMVTESFKGMEDKLEYSMIGHSGDSPAINLVGFDTPPQNKKERLEMVMSMVAHTQYCWSGDNTLESLKHAIKVAAEKDSDQRFVFLISDANLRRYGITTSELARLVKSNPKVHVFCIFIASMGKEAERIRKDLPPGHGHVCYDSSDLPSVLKRIFLATNLLK